MLDPNEQDGLSRLREFVLRRRKPKKWTQTIIAERAGISQSWVASLESNRLQSLPQQETLTKLARGLALPGEDPAHLYRLMERLIHSEFDWNEIFDVAEGRESPETAVRRHLEQMKVLEPLDFDPFEDPDPHFEIRVKLRKEGRGLVLQVLKRDLMPDDFAALQHLVNLMYDRQDARDGTMDTSHAADGEQA